MYRPLIILNINGDIIRKSKPICTFPKSITRTKNGNIFVVDECEGNGKVIIIDDKEEEVNAYTGSNLTHDNKFTPENITATASDIVIITEPNEHNIYFLTNSGQYITHYNTEHISILYNNNNNYIKFFIYRGLHS